MERKKDRRGERVQIPRICFRKKWKAGCAN